MEVSNQPNYESVFCPNTTAIEAKKEKESFEKFAPLLHKKWVNSSQKSTIRGYWAEDNSTYELTVPATLVSLLIELQNHLSEKYQATCLLKNQLKQAEKELESLLG